MFAFYTLRIFLLCDFHLRINWSKTELIQVGDGPDPPPLQLDGIYIHFGSTVLKICDLKVDVDQSQALVGSVMQSLWRPSWGSTMLLSIRFTPWWPDLMALTLKCSGGTG